MRFLLLSLLFSFSANAANLQGVGVFETLNKPWFMVGLYVDSNQPEIPQRIEFRVIEDKISQQRFRQILVEAIAVAHEENIWQKHADELERFFSALQGPLRVNDRLVLERQGDESVLNINLLEHARFSAEFIDVLTISMTGKIVLSSQLRAGLLGELPNDKTQSLKRKFDLISPSLGRIAETARWLRARSTAVNNLASTPNV